MSLWRSFMMSLRLSNLLINFIAIARVLQSGTRLFSRKQHLSTGLTSGLLHESSFFRLLCESYSSRLQILIMVEFVILNIRPFQNLLMLVLIFLTRFFLSLFFGLIGFGLCYIGLIALYCVVSRAVYEF